MKIPGFIDADPQDANWYLSWVRYMLGVMGPGDVIYAQHERAVRRIAKMLWEDARPWKAQRHRIYRGVRLCDPDIDGKTLPFYIGRDGENIGAFSFSEDVNIACHFADPDPVRGFGSVKELPPHGYVIEMDAHASDVLFHWTYLDRYPIFRRMVFAEGSAITVGKMNLELPAGHVDWLLKQKEVTIRNHRGLVQVVKKFPEHYPDYVPPTYYDEYPSDVAILRRLFKDNT